MKIAIVLGTRPEIIKMSPVIDEIVQNNTDYVIIHTGQHYDEEMSDQFFIDLKLNPPKYNIGTGSFSANNQISLIIKELESILEDENVDIVLVQGDTNAVLAGALAANKLKIPVGHVEAGLRSFDKNMPEELNRLVADCCSLLYFVPTEETAINLLNEGINHKNIIVTGNTIVDACYRNIDIAKNNTEVDAKIKFNNDFIALTLHRAENVDDKERLTNIVDSLVKLPYNILFSLHPHTKNSLIKWNLLEKLENASHIQISKPMSYLEFLYVLSRSKLILTDSGGIQEEAITLNIPCVTLRYNTERPETVSAGGNVLVGTESEDIMSTINNILTDEKLYNKMSEAKNPYGDGNSAKKIYQTIKDFYDNDELQIKRSDEIMDFVGYQLIQIRYNITVEDYERDNSGHIIEQVFNNGSPECIFEDLNLKDKTILIKKFRKL